MSKIISKTAILTVGLAASLALVTACESGSNTSDATPVPLPPPSGTTQPISEQNLVHLWPLNVDHGTIECRNSKDAIFVAPDHKVYALNKEAENSGVPSIEPLRRTGADGGKISLGSLLSNAMALCKR
jgi:hypothetical protein